LGLNQETRCCCDIRRHEQAIGGNAHVGAAATKAQLQQLIEQLSTELQQAPAEQADAAEQIAKRAESAVAEATKPKPDAEKERYPGAAGSDSGAEQKGEARGKAFPLARAAGANRTLFMKIYKHLFAQVCSFDNLWLPFHAAVPKQC
jgi:hypothetical protein